MDSKKEEKRNYDKEYYIQNRDKKLKYQREYNFNHKGKYKEYLKVYGKKWKKDNKDRVNLSTHKRRAKIKSQVCYKIEEWIKMKEFYDYTCLCCGKKEPEIKITLDHIIPLIKGGSNSIENIQPLCGSCNSSKKDKIIDYRKQINNNQKKYDKR